MILKTQKESHLLIWNRMAWEWEMERAVKIT
jgi:hypothetical protein